MILELFKKRNDLGKIEILKQNRLGEKTTTPWPQSRTLFRDLCCVSAGPAIMTVGGKRGRKRGKHGWKCVKCG